MIGSMQRSIAMVMQVIHDNPHPKMAKVLGPNAGAVL